MSSGAAEALRAFRFFCDCEASGLDDASYPIEIAVVSDDFEYHTLIKPHESWTYWDTNAEENFHRISRAKLEAEGKPIDVVCNELNQRLEGKTIWADSRFDRIWSDVLFETAGIPKLFKVENIQRALPELIWKKLLMEIPDENNAAHRALDDANELKNAWKRVIAFVERAMS
ncbi:exonuclease domain-containing protein [Pseudomonas luteola]